MRHGALHAAVVSTSATRSGVSTTARLSNQWPVRHLPGRVATLVVLGAIACASAAAPQPASVEAQGDAVIFAGRIDAQSAARFIELVRDPRITRLVMTSRGGLVSAALDIGAAVRERRLDIEVPVVCLSSCANYIFPAARRKLIGRPGAVAWHGNMAHVLYQQQHGTASWSKPEIDDARVLAQREAAFFKRIGVDGFVCWFAKIEPYNVPDFYYLSPGDMERFGIRDVTVTDPSAEPPGNDEQLVQVDWTRLEADRPAVPLQ